MAYTDQTTIEKYLQRELTDDEKAIIDVLINAVKIFIDSTAGKTFEAATETRYYDGNDKKELFIDECQAITAISYVDMDDDEVTAYTTDDYLTWPYNEDTIKSIVKKSGYWPSGIKNIKIAGSFGSATSAPDNVVTLATMIAAKVMENPQDIISESIEGYSKTIAQAVGPTEQKLLDSIAPTILI